MEDLFLGILLLITMIIGFILYEFFAAKKDDKAISILKSNLLSQGFVASNEIEIPDQYNPAKNFCFLTDNQHKRWVLANYRETSANQYHFSNLQDYVVIYRTKGNSITKGKEVHVTASDILHSISEENGILQNSTEENCEFIEIRLIYSGCAKQNNLPDSFLLFEEASKESFSESDFLIPSACIENAKLFEKILINILMENQKNRSYE